MSLFGWLRRLISPAQAPAPTPAKPVAVMPPPSNGFFSTEALPPRHERTEEGIRNWLRGVGSTVFQRTHADIKVVTRNGAIALDSVAASAMDENDTIKAAYNFGYSGVPEAQVAWYAAQGFIGYQMCAVLVQHWLIDKACTMPARDATRGGWDVTVNDGTEVKPEVLDYMKKLDKDFRLSDNAREFVRHCRIYGIRIALFKVNSPDQDYYEKPFNPDGVTAGSYKGISQVDPYWITPELDMVASSDPASIHFYEPTFWRINGKRYHRSHLIVIRTCDPPDVLKPTYFYGGIPLPQRIYERVYAAERTANEAPQLALTKRSNVIHVDMEAMAANQVALEQRLQEAAYYRDNYGYKVVGLEETMEQFDTSLNDLDEAIMTQYQLVAAIAEVPATKLLGTTPKGFNATGEYEESSYHEFLESIQTHDIRPLLERHYLLLVRSYVVPKFKVEPFEVGVVFAELDAETSKEKAERQFIESQAAKNYSDTGAIDGTDIREKLIADEESGWNGLSKIMPEGATPVGVVQPGATKEAPNTPPGSAPAAPPPPAAQAKPPAAQAPPAAPKS